MRLIWHDVPWCDGLPRVVLCHLPSPDISRHLPTSPDISWHAEAVTQQKLCSAVPRHKSGSLPARSQRVNTVNTSTPRHVMSDIHRYPYPAGQLSSRIFQYYFWRFRWRQLFVLNCPSMTHVLQEWGWGLMASNVASSVVSCNVLNLAWGCATASCQPSSSWYAGAGMAGDEVEKCWTAVELPLNCPCPCEPKLAHWRPQPLA